MHTHTHTGLRSPQPLEALRLYVHHICAEGMCVYGLCPLLMAAGAIRCFFVFPRRGGRSAGGRGAGEQACGGGEGWNSIGAALLSAYVVYMLGFHWLANLPLDQPLYYRVHVRFWMQVRYVER